MVKDVLQTNLRLRQESLEFARQVDQLKAELFQVHCENEEFREKFLLIASAEPCPADTASSNILESRPIDDIANLTAKSALNASSTSPVHSKISVVSELYQMKKDKDMLERRLQQLERENIHIRANSGATAGERREDVSGTDDFEPVRSVMNHIVRSVLPPPANRRRTSHLQYIRYRSKGRERKDDDSPENVPRTSYAKLRNVSMIQDRGSPTGFQAPQKEWMPLSTTQRLQDQVVEPESKPHRAPGAGPPRCRSKDLCEAATGTRPDVRATQHRFYIKKPGPTPSSNRMALKEPEESGGRKLSEAVDYSGGGGWGKGLDLSYMDRTQYQQCQRPVRKRYLSNLRASSKAARAPGNELYFEGF